MNIRLYIISRVINLRRSNFSLQQTVHQQRRVWARFDFGNFSLHPHPCLAASSSHLQVSLAGQSVRPSFHFSISSHLFSLALLIKSEWHFHFTLHFLGEGKDIFSSVFTSRLSKTHSRWTLEGGSRNLWFWLTKYVNSPFQLLNMNIYWHGHTLKTMYVPSTPWEHLIMPIAHKSWQGGRGGQPKAYICWQRGGGLRTPVFGWRNMWTAPNFLDRIFREASKTNFW